MAPGDADPDYRGPQPSFGAGDNFNRQPTPMAAGNNQPSANKGILAILFLLPVIFFFLLICGYASLRRRQYRGISLSGRTNISRHRGFSFAREDPSSLRNAGLDARVVGSLPVFKYKAESFKDALECAVCLSEFEENEKARLLPNCKHSFHVDCIDMWFRSHSTCPICRTGAQPKQWVGNNNTDEISINVELISSGNREICIGPGFEQGETSSQDAKTALDEGPSTSGTSSMPETGICMPGRPGSFSSEKQACLHSGSQSSRTALHSLKRMLSRGSEGRVFPDALQDHGIETEGQPQACLHSGSQSSRTALQSLKRMLSRGTEERVFPDALQDHGIETEGQTQACLDSGSQSSRTALHSLKRMLSRGSEGRVFPDALQDHGIETKGQTQACLHSGSQSSRTALNSLKRMLSRGTEGRVFLDALQGHGIETEGQPQSRTHC